MTDAKKTLPATQPVERNESTSYEYHLPLSLIVDELPPDAIARLEEGWRVDIYSGGDETEPVHSTKRYLSVTLRQQRLFKPDAAGELTLQTHDAPLDRCVSKGELAEILKAEFERRLKLPSGGEPPA